MKKLSREEFIALKKSDTVVIFGSGYSLNKISEEQWDKIRTFDSIGFNWFCHHDYGPTFFILREQANTKKRNLATETRDRLWKDLQKEAYADTCIVVHDLKHSPKSYSYVKNTKNIAQKGIIVNDRKGRLSHKQFRVDIFNKGIYHGKITLNNAIHLALFLDYKKIIFAGVDLYDSRYFWLHPKKTRVNIKRAGKNRRSKHPVTKNVLRSIRTIKKHFKVKMYTLNKKSLLTRMIKAIDL